VNVTVPVTVSVVPVKVAGCVTVVTGLVNVKTRVVAGVVSVDTTVTAVVVWTTVVVTWLTPNASEKPGVATNPITKAITTTAKIAYATYRAALPLAETLPWASILFSGTVTQPG
jgi:hypothetical protein